MVINTTKGYFEVIKNVREALDIETFQNKYLEEFFDSYTYIVGDIASDTIRLKGFSLDSSKTNYYKYIPDYLCESCAYRGAYFILRRIDEAEYNVLAEKYSKNPNNFVTVGEEKGLTIEKTPFDKEQLVLESTAPGNRNIKFDMARINSVKTFPLPDDLKEDPKTLKDRRDRDNRGKDTSKNQNGNNNNNNKKNNYNNNNKPKPQAPQSFNNSNNDKKSFASNPNKKAFSNNKKK